MSHEQAPDLGQAARLVLSHYPPLFWHGTLTAPADLPHGGGFSGADVFHLQVPRAAFCLRAWPAGDGAAQVAFRHRLMHHARGAGLAFVPALVAPRSAATDCPWAVWGGGRLWELCEWLPGRADFWMDPAPARLEDACQAVAELHCAWESLAPPGAASCPAIDRRLALLEHSRTLLQRLGPARLPAPLRSLVEAARTLLPEWLDRIPPMIEPWRMLLWRLQPCLCDVWHDHLLFCGHELTGLVDYGAVKIDNVAVDLARLLGSLVEDDGAAWKLGLTAYRQVRRLAAEEEALARALDRSGTVLALGNWLGRLCGQAGPVTNVDGVRRRLERLIRRIQSPAFLRPV
jgi:Ser/Thr protein kinase RdoA (MazF antagonist)